MTEQAVTTTVDTRARWWLAGLLAAALLFCAGAVLAPVAARELGPPGALLRLAYRPACHQIPARCLNLGWGPLAVCARCTGLYLGATAALLGVAVAARTVRPSWPWLVAAALPTAVDFAAGVVGLPSLANWPRFAVALPLGALCGLYVADAVVDIASRRRPENPLQ